MKKTPFSPPRIDQKTIDAVTEVLRSGWITTGPKTKQFEQMLAAYCNVEKVLCLNSATAGLELMLRWYGVGPGDEVIVPAYTYCASANVIVHCGATPVFVDVLEDFTLDPEAVRKALTVHTKVIIPVDIAGWPCDYDALLALLSEPLVCEMFTPAHPNQEKLGRPMLLADAAHSLGGVYKNRMVGALADATVFSFHAVKNLTTAEGGAIAFSLPDSFDPQEVYNYLNIFSLHGQNKDARAKMEGNSWRYDVIEAGYKCNMTDIQAAMGCVELERYDETLARREKIFKGYAAALSQQDWAVLPPFRTADRVSSFHVFALRLKGFREEERDRLLQEMLARGVSVNVHFIPVPMLAYYKQLGYTIDDYPVAHDLFSHEISLPVYYDLSDQDAERVTDTLISCVQHILTNA
ncbi:MAG: DegT/DnrJ/EryC1/StrS family aminotransferase [Flavobacteriales bacterium]|nr:DegT/DnrJ/EryC1/StrS family aminotransferase [Flavobacteriales bacterium]MCB9447732.1 DegT/DnrJ/EryC1/StrS family aminotransferase [Flavobacteriales bacterium]